MTRDGSFKKVVRARMRRTGERYTVALAHVQRMAPPPRPVQRGGSSMYPFERFTERAKKVLTLAQEEAESARHNHIGTEHLLLGLLREEEGLARTALYALGVELVSTREAIQRALSTAPKGMIFQIRPTSRVKKVIEIAFQDSERMGDGNVGTQHLLFGLLIEGKGMAARILVDMGVTLDKARAEIDRLLKEGAQEPTLPQRPTSRPKGRPRAWSTILRLPGVRGLGKRIAAPLPMLPELQRLLHRAQTHAAGKGSSAFGLDDVLYTMLSSPAGIEVMARLLDVRRIAAMKEQAIAARDFETAAEHRTSEKRAREALEQAMTEWRKELEPPGTAEAS